MTRLQHFGWFVARGFGPQGWGAQAHRWGWDWTSPELYQQAARELDRAQFDLLVFEDAVSMGGPDTLDLRVRNAFGAPKHDPLLLAPYLFQATTQLGIVPTVNPASMPAYTAARQLATLHHLAGHRLGVNVVTDTASARHFGAAQPLSHDGAYERADEWLTAVRQLWHSWPDGSLRADSASGVYADLTGHQPLEVRGRHVRLDGPLNALPFSLGDPIVVSPGGSARGLAFAGAHADVHLALPQTSEAGLRAHRAALDAAAIAQGRPASDLKLLLAIEPVIVPSTAEADRLVAASLHPDDDTLRRLGRQQSSDLETDLTALDLDHPLPTDVFGDHVSRGSIARLVGDRDPATTPLRAHLTALARLGRMNDRTGFVGTAEEFADVVEELGDLGSDGILIWGDLHPVTVHRALDDLVPVLRRRGLLRSEPAGDGIRATLSAF